MIYLSEKRVNKSYYNFYHYRMIEVAKRVFRPHRCPESGEYAAGQDAGRPHPRAHWQV